MQTQKWVNLGLLIGTGILFLFTSLLVGLVWDAARLPLPEEFPIEPAYLVGFLVAAAVGFWARKSDQVNGYLNEVVMELSRVTWPPRKETVASAGVVVILVGLASLLLFVVDSLWGTMIRGVLSL